MMSRLTARRGEEGGQIIVLFALAMVAIIAMVGLVLDGGSAFSQRRAEQSAADLAALAAGNSLLLTGDEAVATATARSTAAENGFTHGVDGTVVSTSYDYTVGAIVTVDVTALHRNNFVSIVGMPTWTVTTTATARTGIPDGTTHGGPLIFSIDAFGADGEPLPQYADPLNPWPFGEINNDAPETAGDFAWTNYGTGNVDSDQVRDIIEGDLVISKTIDFGEYVGQQNEGNHTTLYTAVDVHMAGQCYSVPVVDHNGTFQGWATFCIEYTSKATKQVYGYFKSPWISETLTVGCEGGTCPRYLGNYELRLIN
jgi:Flp pilus assembly protein TadG